MTYTLLEAYANNWSLTQWFKSAVGRESLIPRTQSEMWCSPKEDGEQDAHILFGGHPAPRAAVMGVDEIETGRIPGQECYDFPDRYS
jgi:hypothetical protein